MPKEDQQILVVEKDILFEDNYFEGFSNHSEFDYESKILSNLEVMRRGGIEETANHPEGNAELNTDYKQPIGYAVVANPGLKKVFAYQRSEKAGEKRLHNKWSWGFGGHIEASEIANKNPILTSMIREVTQEELKINGDILSQKVLGYINYDNDEVGQVHFGILYLINTNAEIVEPRDPEIALIEPKTINDLEEICLSKDVDVETWSQISLNPLKEYFK